MSQKLGVQILSRIARPHSSVSPTVHPNVFTLRLIITAQHLSACMLGKVFCLERNHSAVVSEHIPAAYVYLGSAFPVDAQELRGAVGRGIGIRAVASHKG